MKYSTSHPSQIKVSEEKPKIPNEIEVHCSDLGLMQFDERRYVHATIDFSAYKEFKLRSITNAELPESVSHGVRNRGHGHIQHGKG